MGCCKTRGVGSSAIESEGLRSESIFFGLLSLEVEVERSVSDRIEAFEAARECMLLVLGTLS
jgi:hypothetical protein